MARFIRIALVIIVFFGIVVTARNQTAWAANLPSWSNSSAPARVVLSAPQSQDDDCDKESNKDKNKCKDKDKDKDKCKKNKDDCGTVKPPPGAITITKSGTYNVGGFCNYTVEFAAPNPGISVRVALERPLPRSLPDGVHKVRQGCRVTYSQNGQRIEEFTDAMGTSQICFAPTPGQEMTIYYYNVYDASPEWQPVAETTMVKGLVCSPADPSAVYVATFQTP